MVRGNNKYHTHNYFYKLINLKYLNIRQYILFLFILAFGFSGFCDSDESVFDVSNNKSYVFEYSAAYSEKSVINNFFIKEIAKYNLSSLYNTKFTYHYSISKKIKKLSTYTYEVEVLVKGEKCTGNTFYKGFNISDILMPEFADFRIIVEDNGNYIQSREVFELNQQENHYFKTTFEFDTGDEKKNFDLIVADIEFYSEDSDRQIFYDRINQIDNYYAAIAAIDNSLQRFEKVNFSPSMMIKSYMQLREFERVYNLISHSSFTNELDIADEKQTDYINRINEFDNKLQLFTSQYNNRLTTLDYLYISDDLSGLAETYVNEVNYFCFLSDETTHAYQAYFYNLGMVDYSNLNKDNFEKGFNDILSRTKYKKNADEVVQLFYKEILNVYISKSDELIINNEYNLARGLLLNAQKFSLSFIDEDPPLKLSIQLSKANYGIYNSYLHLIDRAIEIGNYELADNYIDKASTFQQQNSASIISTQSIRNVSVELIKLYLNKGFKLIKNEEYFEANYCFEQAQLKCRIIEIYNHDYVIKHGLLESRNGLYNQYVFQAQRALLNNDYEMAKKHLGNAQELVKSYPSQIVELKEFYEIKSKLLQQAYNEHVFDGKSYFAKGNVTQSYIELLAAVQLQNSPEIIKDETLMKAFNEATAKYLIAQCQLGGIKVKKKELDQARVIYDNCSMIQSEYNLYNEQDLIAGMSILNNDIIDQQCNIVKDEYKQKIFEIDNLVKQGEYLQAQTALYKVEKLMQFNYSCGVDRNVLAGLNEYVPYAAEYQQLSIEAQQALENNNNEKLMDVFKEMEVLSSEHEYIRKWIESKPLFYLFGVKRNLAYLESSINTYNSDEEMQVAMRMMDVLASGAATGRESKPIQVQMAEKLALADQSNNATMDPSQSVEKYTDGNSYYRYFKKAYLTAWNNQ